MKKTSILRIKTSGRADKSIKRSVEVAKQWVQKRQTAKLSGARVIDETPQLTISPEHLPDLASVRVTDTTVFCSFEDGRTVSFPLQWSDKLAEATSEQRQALEFNAHFIFWDAIDEIIGVRNILLGKELHW